MKSRGISLLLTLLMLLTVQLSWGQNNVANRFLQIENNLEALKVDNPGLTENVELSVNGVSIQEFLRGIASSNRLNISVDPSLDIKVVNNFSNVSVADMLIFLARNYNLDYQFIGNIISVAAFVPPPQPVIEAEKYTVSYNQPRNLLTLDLRSDSLSEVIKSIVSESGKNVILAPGMGDRRVSVYLLNMEFDKALDNFAFANGMVVEKSGDVYVLNAKEAVEAEQEALAKKKAFGRFTPTGNLTEPVKGLSLDIKGPNDISVYAEQVPIGDLIKAVSSELNVNYYMQSKIDGLASVKLANYTYEDLLAYLMQGTNFTFKKENGIYLLGERVGEGLRKTIVYPLQHRTVEKITDHIPAELRKSIEIKEFNDLNSLLLSGSAPVIDELTSFIRQIDQVVPVIAIEIIIVDYNKTRSINTGISAGIGAEPRTSGGTVLPGVDYNLGAASINSILSDLDFGGAVNLGQVTPNFYARLEALEADGLVNVRSTPKLATLNGHEANLSIGSTEYYVEQTNNVIGAQNPQNIFTRQYRSVNADLSVTIKPFVSGDNQITLEVSVDQSDFTGARVEPGAPPNSVSRSFSSMLRVKNKEMILLGGLEQKSNSRSSSGLPLLARIPVLKWIFARQSRDKRNSRLNILIKPTVIY